MQVSKPNLVKAKSIKQARKDDALALAELIYDMFKKEELRKELNGQNSASPNDKQ